jgi:Flp pilus assembly protein TadG
MRGRRRRSDSGATAVEFALISIPFFVLVIGMIQYGWYFYVSQSTGGAASNVARRLQVGDCWGSGEATALAQDQAAMVNGVTVAPGDLSGLEPGDQITVTVTANGKIIGLIPLPNGGVVDKVVIAQLEDKESSGSC